MGYNVIKTYPIRNSNHVIDLPPPLPKNNKSRSDACVWHDESYMGADSIKYAKYTVIIYLGVGMVNAIATLL